MDGVLDQVSSKRNVYASVSWYQPWRDGNTYSGYSVQSDKVSFDFDSSAKAESEADSRWDHPSIPDDESDAWIINRMRDDSDLREAVLGDVCEEVQQLAIGSREASIPVFGVFSGFGIHLHQLYEETNHRVEDKLASNARKWIDELDLQTVDEKASGKQFRIMRFPNTERIIHGAEIEQSGIFQIPLTGSELCSVTPDDLIGLSDLPRHIDVSESVSRISMSIHEEYIGPNEKDSEKIDQEIMRSAPSTQIGSDLAQTIIKDITKMPCVYERALSRNPSNEVRVKLGAMLLNAGFSPMEATDIISEIGWIDFDRSVTRYQLEKLLESGKGDFSCQSMRMKGLCVRADNPRDCPMYGYTGGNVPDTEMMKMMIQT